MFDAVMVCSGHHILPNIPLTSFPGEEGGQPCPLEWVWILSMKLDGWAGLPTKEPNVNIGEELKKEKIMDDITFL